MATSYNHETVAYYRAYRYSLHSANINKDLFKMNGARRVVVFCLVTVVLPTILIIIPLYLRNSVFADVLFEVAESDVLEVGDDISPVFCQEHTLKMNASFNAYQVDSKPEISNTRKHIRLKKSMRLPDDTLEYWGFFLPKGSIVQLSVCSRYDGSRILVVKGMKNLHTCGLLDHSKKSRPDIPQYPGTGNFRVRFEMDDTELFAPSPKPPVAENHPSAIADKLFNETTTRAARSIEEENHGGEELDDSPAKDESLGPVRNRRRHAQNGNTHRRSRDRRRRSNLPGVPHNLDGKVVHGGIAANQTDDDGDSSESSFEAELLDCYGGNILLKQEFPSSSLCANVSYLVRNHTSRMTTTHTVVEDGYYYYIFYSDNDLVENDIHAVFDIHKPTYQYANISKRCINETSCTFPVAFLSKEIVIVEVPTRDGIEHEAEDITMLVSVCHPRMAVYIIFPLLVLILILGCAFL